MCAHTCAVMHSTIWIWIHRTLSGSGPPHLVLEQRLSCFCSTVLLFRPLWVLLSPSHTHIEILHTASRRPTPSHNLTWVLRTKLKLSRLYRVCSYPLKYPTAPQYIFWKFDTDFVVFDTQDQVTWQDIYFFLSNLIEYTLFLLLTLHRWEHCM